MITPPDAKLVVVTPGQQAPLGSTLSLERRLKLLDWATTSGAWIIEDDYLSELQLTGRAAPALASIDSAERVYATKREELLAQLRRHFDADQVTAAGLAVLVRLPDGTPDLIIVREMLAFGMFPSPLSAWYTSAQSKRSGLLLGAATSPTKELAKYCVRLANIIQRFS